MKPVGRSIDYFDNANVQVVAVSSVFRENRPATAPLYRVPPQEEKRELAPFYGGSKCGPLGQKFPAWMPDPDSHRIVLQKKELEAAKLVTVPFVPPSVPKTMPVKSIIFHEPGYIA
jgi:hypothetical protein